MKILPVVLLLAVLGTAGCASEPAAARDASGAVTTEGSVDAFAVALGDCIDEPDDAADSEDEVTDVDSVRAVPCDAPHDGEVYSVFDLPDGDYPGEDEIVSTGDERCLEDFEAFVGVPYDDSKYDFTTLFPSEV